jgi:hypothetical protein
MGCMVVLGAVCRACEDWVPALGLLRFACFGCTLGAGVLGWVCSSAGNVRYWGLSGHPMSAFRDR